jgi:hypothetical protein
LGKSFHGISAVPSYPGISLEGLKRTMKTAVRMLIVAAEMRTDPLPNAIQERHLLI